MTTALLVMTDGREHIFDVIPSAEAALPAELISERWIHDDSGDPRFAVRLRKLFPDYRVISTAGRSGFGGAIRSAWEALRRNSSAPFVFHLEDDFTFNRPVDLAGMIWLLEHRPHLVNMALRRQPWNDAERAAGGIVEQHPGAYHECEHHEHTETMQPIAHLAWLEHRLFFTTNPGIYRRRLLFTGWPEGAESEGRFSHQLLADPAVRFGYFGGRNSGEAVHHIGTERKGTGY